MLPFATQAVKEESEEESSEEVSLVSALKSFKSAAAIPQVAGPCIGLSVAYRRSVVKLLGHFRQS
jgi:hypothetical protein